MKFLWSFIIFFFLISFSVYAQDPCSHVDIKWLNTHVRFPAKAKIIHKKPKENFCEAVVLIDTDLIPFYCGDDFVISGQLIKNNRFLTDETLASLSHIAKKAEKLKKIEDEKKEKKRRAFLKDNILKLKEMVSFKIGPKKYKKSLYFVTDPMCSHCKDMIKELKDIAFENEILVECVIYPLLGEKSEDLAKKAICKKLEYEDYIKLSEDSSTESCKEADSVIKKEKDFFEKAEINFVPLVVSAKGDWIVEGGDIELVIKNLGIKE